MHYDGMAGVSSTGTASGKLTMLLNEWSGSGWSKKV